MRRTRSDADIEASISPQSELPALPVSSLLPRRTWVLALLVGCGLLAWVAVVGLGVWVDLQQLDPWRDIFGIQSGRLLRFYTTLSLLTCAQLSYLILWRRSRSRKDFAGRYRVWFWVGAVCSIFCVATATRFHEVWAGNLTRGMNLAWAEATTVCWMVPATTLLMSAMHLMRRDMPHRSVSKLWVRVSRGLAILAGFSLLLGSLVWPAEWVVSVNAALCALWPTVFAASLLIHARFVTYVTNEASRELLQPRRPTRWETRLKTFARHVALMAGEEWQVQREKRAAAKAAKSAAKGIAPVVASVPESPPQRERRVAQASSATQASAPLQRMLQRRAADNNSRNESEAEVASAPTTKAVNARPISRPIETPAEAHSVMQPVHVHPAQPIPAPHFEMTEESLMESGVLEDGESGESDTAGRSTSIPSGYSAEQWKNLSKKDRKRLLRAESMR